MIKSNASLQPKSRKSLIVHRLMLASVASLGMAVLLAEPGVYRGAMNLPAWSSSAQAAETIPQHPAGFADLVAK